MDQPKVAVIHHGQAGALQALAKEVAAGAEEVGARVRVRRIANHAVSEPDAAGHVATPADVHWADAVVLGTPSRYGNLAAPLMAYLEQLEAVDGERLGEIVWSGFAAEDPVLHGGREATLSTLFHTLSHLGGVLVPAPRAPGMTAHELARRTGRDVADVARRLLHGAAAQAGREPVSS